MTAAEWQALWLSLRVGAVSTLLAFVPATLLAFWLARTSSRLRLLVEALVLMPLVLPPVVVGYLLLVVFGRRGWLGGWLYDVFGVSLPFHWQGAALAALVMGMPLMVRGMRQAFEAVDPGLGEAAATLGASRLDRFVSVEMGMAWPGLLAGAGLCFARSLGEFGATITFAGNVASETRTLPLSIWSAMQQADGEAAAWRLTCVSIAVAVLATVICELLVRRQRRSVSSGGGW